MNANEWGARIERGIIKESNGDEHRVRSLDRDGVITPWIRVLEIKPKITVQATHDVGDTSRTETLTADYSPTEYTTGDRVYFFLFADGHGAILGKAT